MSDQGPASILFLMAALMFVGGIGNVFFTDAVIRLNKSVYKHSPIKPVGLTVPLVRAVGYLAFAVGIVAAIAGPTLAFR